MRNVHEPQHLYLVFGGELVSLDGMTFGDPSRLDVVGIFPTYAAASVAWKGRAQRTVDNAHMRYFIVPLHGLLASDGQPAERPDFPASDA